MKAEELFVEDCIYKSIWDKIHTNATLEEAGAPNVPEGWLVGSP